MRDVFEATGDGILSLHEPRYSAFCYALLLWAEEYATMRRMQGVDGIQWGRDSINYNTARLAVELAASKEAEEKKP